MGIYAYIYLMNLKEKIKDNLDVFQAICKEHSVEYLYAFGSSVTSRFNEITSDIDLVVEIDEKDPVEKGEKLISLWDSLEAFFQRKVDLLTERTIINPFLRRSIDSTRVLIYDGSAEKIFV